MGIFMPFVRELSALVSPTSFPYPQLGYDEALQLPHVLFFIDTHTPISIRASSMSVVFSLRSNHRLSGGAPVGSRFSVFVPHLYHIVPAFRQPKVYR